MDIDFLQVCKQIKSQITASQKKINQLNDLITAINPNVDGLPRASTVSSRVEALATMIIDMQKKISDLKKIFADCLADLATRLFVLVANDTVRQVLLYRYGYCKPFKVISSDLGFCERQIYKFHSAGLTILKNQLQGSNSAVAGQ